MADISNHRVKTPASTLSAAPSTARYSNHSRLLHWLMAGLVVLAYVFIEGRGWFPKGSALKTFFIQGHFWVGLLVLALVLPRLLVRLRSQPPGVEPALKPAMHLLSKLTHFGLYAFLLVQPLMGLLVVLLERGGIPLGSLTIASPFALDKHLAHSIEDIHVWVGTAFYYVIGLHIVAAFWHHFYVRDNVLKRML
jgi:cytochrome b561